MSKKTTPDAATTQPPPETKAPPAESDAATTQPAAPDPEPPPTEEPPLPPPPAPPSFSEILARHADAVTLAPTDHALIDEIIKHLPKATTDEERIQAATAALHILSSPSISLPRRQIRPLARTAAHHLLTITHLPQSIPLSTLLNAILSLPQ